MPLKESQTVLLSSFSQATQLPPPRGKKYRSFLQILTELFYVWYKHIIPTVYLCSQHLLGIISFRPVNKSFLNGGTGRVYIWLGGVHAFMCLYITLYIIPLKYCLSLDLQLEWRPASPSLLFLPTPALELLVHNYVQLFTCVLGFELRFLQQILLPTTPVVLNLWVATPWGSHIRYLDWECSKKKGGHQPSTEETGHRGEVKATNHTAACR